MRFGRHAGAMCQRNGLAIDLVTEEDLPGDCEARTVGGCSRLQPKRLPIRVMAQLEHDSMARP